MEASKGQADRNVAPMPTSRHGLGAAVLGVSIWVVGGGPQAGLTVSATNERFTP